MRNGGWPTTNGFSGPSIEASIRSIEASIRSRRISIGTLMPPSLNLADGGRVVNSRNVPCVPNRSGTDIALSSAP